ncbi:MAG: hypothetical protein QOJ79_296 [Actinomycetota bacterium]|jgi:hypothetical protein|nr:hypothetical protein [Actinomycetota bacterium]
MKRLFLIVLAALLLPAAAVAHADPPTYFSGNCLLSGVLESQQGVAWTPGRVRWDIDVRGTCTGTLDRKAVTAAPVRMTETLIGDHEGCLPAGTATATGLLDFGGAARLGFSGRQAALPLLVMRGDAGGVAGSIQTAYTLAGSDGAAECTASSYRRGAFEVRIRADQELVG